MIRVKEHEFEAPDTVEGGLVLVTLENVGTTRHMAMFVRPNEGTTIDQLQAEILKDPSEAHIRPLLTVASGPGAIPPGDQERIVMDLEPGSYLLLCFESGPDGVFDVVKGEMKPIEVTAPTRTDLPEPASDLQVSLVDFAFATLPAEVAAGQYIWKVTNDGTEPHELQLLKLAPGKTVQEIFSAPPKPGEPEPYVVAGAVQDMAPGGRAWVEVDLTPGDYAAFCAIPDPATGKPHLMLGMVASFHVS